MQVCQPFCPLKRVDTHYPKPVSSEPISQVLVASSPNIIAKVPPYCIHPEHSCLLWAVTMRHTFSNWNISSSWPECGMRSQLRPASWPQNPSTWYHLRTLLSMWPFWLLKFTALNISTLPPIRYITPSGFSSSQESPKSSSGPTPAVGIAHSSLEVEMLLCQSLLLPMSLLPATQCVASVIIQIIAFPLLVRMAPITISAVSLCCF